MDIHLSEHAVLVALRLLCGAFFLPHIAAKLSDRAPSIELFTAVGLRPARLWVWAAIFVEAVVATGLLLGLEVRICAAGGALFLVVAGLVILRASKATWYWNKGGAEYCFFWAACCATVALAS